MLAKGKMMFYGSAKELVKVISRLVDFDTLEFPSVDFAEADNIDEAAIKEKGLQWACNNAESWFGIKSINSGFDSSSMELLGNYYGGGCGVYTEIYEEGEIEESIKYVLENIMDSKWSGLDKTMLIAEIETSTTNC